MNIICNTKITLKCKNNKSAENVYATFCDWLTIGSMKVIDKTSIVNNWLGYLLLGSGLAATEKDVYEGKYRCFGYVSDIYILSSTSVVIKTKTQCCPMVQVIVAVVKEFLNDLVTDITYTATEPTNDLYWTNIIIPMYCLDSKKIGVYAEAYSEKEVIWILTEKLKEWHIQTMSDDMDNLIAEYDYFNIDLQVRLFELVELERLD